MAEAYQVKNPLRLLMFKIIRDGGPIYGDVDAMTDEIVKHVNEEARKFHIAQELGDARTVGADLFGELLTKWVEENKE